MRTVLKLSLIHISSTGGEAGGRPEPSGGSCGSAAGAEAKKRFSVGTRLARYKNQLLYIQREREYRDDV